MKKLTLLICFVIIVLLAGCQGKQTPTVAPENSRAATIATSPTTPVPTRQDTPTPIILSPTVSATPTATRTETATSTPVVPLEARLNFQCLETVPTLPSGAASSGIVILESRAIVDGRYRPDTFLLNMATGEISQLARQDETLGRFTISLDNKFVAFSSAIIDAEDKIIKNELIIATADGQRQKTLPWEEKWLTILGWTNDQRLLLSYDEPVLGMDGEQKTPISYLILDPFSGEQQILHPDFLSFLDNADLPYWDGWYGVIYNPMLTQAIYPRFIGSDEEQYTYAIWGVSKQQLVTSLENVYTNFSVFSNTSPLPHWSLDGSRFVFRGQVYVSDQLVEFELYQVSQDGQTEQLTHLTSVALVQESNLSWSPDGRHIAMFLDTKYVANETRVVVLDMETLVITDYCLPIRGVPPPSPIWSPDSKQFMVVDEYEKDHRRVILVDIVQGFAAQIAEDMQPVGWMVSP